MKHKLLTALVPLLALTFYSCQKNNLNETQLYIGGNSIVSLTGSNVLRIGGGIENTDPVKTKLGRKYNNVFSVSNITKAWNAISRSKVAQVRATHLYIKFKPANQQHLNAIFESGLHVYHFPLDYELLEVGNPLLEKGQMPEYYTCVPVKVKIPNCPYELLDKLCLLNMSSPVTKKAFEIAGETKMYAINEQEQQNIASYSNALNDIITEEYDDMDDPWNPIDPDTGGGIIWTPPAPAPPGPANAAPTPSNIVNGGNCYMNSDDRKPSGRILVEETQWGVNEGVSDVLVDCVGPHFQRAQAMTNRYGCFKSNTAILYKDILGIRYPVVMSVIFFSTRKAIIGVNNTNPQEHTMPLVDIHYNISSGGLNNEEVLYKKSTSWGTNDTKYYIAATVNNALYDFDEYAQIDGIEKPKQGIKIMVTSFTGKAMTPMFADIQLHNPIATMEMQSFLVGLGAATLGLLEAVAAFPPDIIIGYNKDDDWFQTDRIKEVAYHEFAHASHYQIATTSEWVDNVRYIATNLGYGQHNSSAGRQLAELIEMWGYFLGREYVHRRYGPFKHSAMAYFTGVTNATFGSSWYSRSENLVFDPSDIPSPFLHDLVDDNAYNISVFPEVNRESVPSDNIRGFSLLIIFNQLKNTIRSDQFVEKLKLQLPPGLNNTPEDYDTLKSYYNF